MKKISLILAVVFCISSSTYFSQMGLLYSAGDRLGQGLAKNKKAKAAEKYSSMVLINSDSVSVMRVPEGKIGSDAKGEILYVQKLLDNAGNSYKSKPNEFIDLGDLFSRIHDVSMLDHDWDIKPYNNEAEAYKKFNTLLEEKKAKEAKEREIKEKRINDSIRIARKPYYDSLELAEKQKKLLDERMEIDRRNSQYNFVNLTEAPLKEKPNAASRTLATVGGGSYVVPIDGTENGYYRVIAEEYIGYIKIDQLVNTVFALSYKGADIETAKKYYSAYVGQTPEQSKYNDLQNRNNRLYHKDFLGCYIYYSNGSKQYVETYYCTRPGARVK